MADTVEVVEVTPLGRTRRRYSAEFKRDLVEQALRPDVSLAAVALANGINTNLLARWRSQYLGPTAGDIRSTALIPVQIVDEAASAVTVPAPIGTTATGELELRHGAAVLLIRGVPEQSVLATVLREVLRTPGAQ
ncbi:IS66-like element accessory protein TnpA [Pararobbsia alpina]|uniref:Transposase n=1 Tax=Pararobbsia alpina TaxID=621374 RepID=A0A6S7BPY4_9BURK|nr:transposase [Pararobbsia alpina]CAB3808300.1 hypothetical protein LMG28138_06033 [Pararobbsia alpina]